MGVKCDNMSMGMAQAPRHALLAQLLVLPANMPPAAADRRPVPAKLARRHVRKAST